MLSLGISQAQSQFTKLLNQTVLVVDKKSNKKKAVILPYEAYERLLKKQETKGGRGFSEFVGVLKEAYETDDRKYHKIVGSR